ncbi:hypothetical protein [Nostoc sp. T09]|uniref:hypothetical protein n=1 Tax=Nostoc sp. T09 TaxID=1932621 RepID=UPI0015C4F41E|nr:hypothetical protein [Nostoc sp. T09]
MAKRLPAGYAFSEQEAASVAMTSIYPNLVTQLQTSIRCDRTSQNLELMSFLLPG